MKSFVALNMSLISLLFSAVLQVTFVFLISYVVYWISYRRKGNLKPLFSDFLGLIKPEKSSVWRAMLIGLALGLLAFALNTSGALQYFSDYNDFVASANSPIAPIKNSGPGLFSFFYAAMYSIIQTGLSEEILFRGLFAKRLIKKFGYKVGNFAQSLIFASIHIVLIIGVRPSSSLTLMGLFFVMPFMLGYIMGSLNERAGNGSIVPSWILHSSANLFVALAVI